MSKGRVSGCLICLLHQTPPRQRYLHNTIRLHYSFVIRSTSSPHCYGRGAQWLWLEIQSVFNFKFFNRRLGIFDSSVVCLQEDGAIRVFRT